MTLAIGCSWRPTEDKHAIADSTFGERHTGHYPQNSVLALASEVTQIEDEIRRNGSITVKAPDVWGDANLVSGIQEYDNVMKGNIGEFEQVLSAYIARSDQAEFQSATAVAAAMSGAPSGTNGTQVTQITLPSVGEGQGSNIPNITPGSLLTTFSGAVPVNGATGVGVEPTELLRQESTYIGVNQTLRRRNMGDDRSRQAGYGLYKFRVPVSILPGRQTNRGYAAVVNMRARLHIDAAHLKYTFPKLVVADVVDSSEEYIFENWDKLVELAAKPDEKAQQLEDLNKKFGENIPGYSLSVGQLRQEYCEAERRSQAAAEDISASPAQPVLTTHQELMQTLQFKYGYDISHPGLGELSENGVAAMAPEMQPYSLTGPNLDGIGTATPTVGSGLDPWLHEEASLAFMGLYVVKEFRKVQPKRAELREFLFNDLSQRYEVLRRQHAIEKTIEGYESPYLVTVAADKLALGCKIDDLRQAWLNDTPCCIDDTKFIDWLLALQAGVLDHNIKRMIEELSLQGKMSPSDAELAKVTYFYCEPCSDQDDAVRLWDTIIQEAFPVHVFALDPQVEEQNAYDAFSRRREMQVALAISAATGRFNLAQKVDMSRQLALDMAAIDLNRTAVAFSHDADTFGWYFYPRIQSPPTEKSNIMATARLIWSNGPTEHYDRKHLEIEPGMRECEVLIAMPSFVPHVDFDVTTNWERLTNPGATKQSYEEMIQLGGRVHRLRCNLREANDQQCFRPGDYSRLLSRVDQLEKMLSLQTYEVDLPFEYEQAGKTLFSQGNVQLRPELFDYYGLNYVTTDKDQGGATYFFLRGRNFHPTLTHVIVGGAKSDSSTPTTNPEVQVISRELIRVKVNALFPNLSNTNSFVIRCATPAGISNPLIVESKTAPPVVKSTPDFALMNELLLSGTAEFQQLNFRVDFTPVSPSVKFLEIANNQHLPLPTEDVYLVVTQWSFDTKEKSTPIISDASTATYDQASNRIVVDLGDVQRKALHAIALGARQHVGDFKEVKGKVMLRIGNWPFQAVGGSPNVKLVSQLPVSPAPEPAAPAAPADIQIEEIIPEPPAPIPPAPPAPTEEQAIRLMPISPADNRLRW
ncbi:hypothetical protein AB1K70_25370 [Bremerella sp. JC770]|uniref:hypothetical protein n=1 Tax=Bremerella sp. JC770 TaxID=3232137 RepID=UPI003457918C